MIEADVERYADPQSFAREVNLPLLGTARVSPLPSGAGVSELLAVQAPPDLARVLDGLTETRKSLTLRSLLLAGFQDDPECFAVGLALAREWSRRGLKVAVVDLDFWSPTVWRPRPHPNEGLVDVLCYGCSFRRVAWEIVDNGLWLVGPGSHPPEGDRIADHPDWERTARAFAAHVDVTFFVAPLLDRSGLVGRLSKRMDGALVVASVERIDRPALRDAFLELWGSDAPIIGCVGILPFAKDATEVRAPAGESGPSGRPTAPEARFASKAIPEGMPGSVLEALPSAPPPAVSASSAPAADAPARPSPAARAPAPAPPVPPAPVAPLVPEEAEEDEDLTAVLDREVRFGSPGYRPRSRSRAGLYAGITAGFALAASIVLVVAPRRPALPPPEETLPAGTERVLSVPPERPLAADLGGAPSPVPAAGDVEPPPDARPPESVIPPSAPTPNKPFRVHVASFQSETKVQGIVRRLRLRGADSWYERAPDAPGYFRVFVGHFATEAEARAHAQWLLDNGWVDRAHAYPSTQR